MNPARRGLAATLVALALALGLGVPLLVRAGGNGILLPGTQPADGSGDPAYPPFNDAGTPGTFDDPGRCDNCHADYRLAGQRIYEPFDTWAGSMMAMAGRDPLFWAALDIANQDDAALGDVGVGDFCLRCHFPKAWYEGRSKCTTPWGESFDGACLIGTLDTLDNDFDGIICAACHRSYDASNPPPGQVADPNAPYAGNAQLYLSNAERQMLGPYSDAQPLSHEFLQSTFHVQSAFCGQCHDVTSPAKNRRDPATGADLGYRMPIERTFSEWRASRFADPAAPEAETCQTCHMPQPDHQGDGRPDAGYACSQEPGLRGEGTALQGPLRTHVFAGANAWMLGVLKGEYGAALLREAQFDRVIEETMALLTRRTATLGITAPPTAQAGTTLPLSARVTNLGGHKFPTGYPEGRRAFVSVAAGMDADADGVLDASEVHFESGAYDAATGVLTQDAQAKVYEVKLGVWDFNGTGQCDLADAAGAPMFHFVLNDCVVEDNRIPPLGFVPTPEIAPVGVAYPDNPALPGTLANWDDTAYAIPVPDDASGTLLLDVRVRYQTTSKEYVEFLRDESRSTCDPLDAGCDPTQPDARPNRGEKMHALWERYGRSEPVDVATARVAVTVTPADPGACCVLGSCSEVLPAECRALEGDFQGQGTTCASAPCAAPLPPPGEPSDVLAGATPLLVTSYDDATGMLGIAFDPACDAADHVLRWGPLSGVSTHDMTGVSCGLGTAGAGSFVPGSGSWWFVVVGLTDQAEGSYGRTSLGAERPDHRGADACDRPQDLSATCR